MSQVTETLNAQRMRVAAIAAGGVAAALFVQDLIGNLSWLLVGYSQMENGGMYVGQLWLTIAYGVAMLLVFAAGVFLSLWLLAPANPSLTVKHVLLRGLLAAVIGAGAVLVVSFGWEMTGRVGAGTLFGSSFPWPSLDRTVQAGSMALQSGMSALLRHAPVVLLVVLLTWIWQGRDASRHADPADVAEV
ncbi:MAG: hypothetical protein WED09_06685 [Homoserinimonas sp.]